MFNYIKKKWKQIIGTIGLIGILLIGGYFLVIFGANWVESKLNQKFNNQKNELIQRFDDLESDTRGNIKVLEKKLDSTSNTVQASSQIINNPNFWDRIFNTRAKQFRDSVLATIPEVIQKEMEGLDLDPESVGEATLTVKGDTVTFSSDVEKVEGYWGEIIKREGDSGDYTYQMVLRPVQIDLQEVRTREDPLTGQPRVFLSAVDRRTGEEIEISSTNFNFIDERKKGFSFDPQFSAGLGMVVLNDENPQPLVTGSLDWLFYRGKSNTYSFLSIDSNFYSDQQRIKQFITLGLVEINFGANK